MATIQFSDGVTTIDLTGATGDYALLHNSWAPKVARRRRGMMGGQSPYEDVQEVMQIKVDGTSETDCLANLTALSELFDQANAWKRDPHNNTAVEIEYQHTGSSTQVNAVIWGAEVIPPSDFTWMGTPDDDFIYPVTLRFMRQGLWLGSTEAEAAATTTGNPAIATTSSFTNTMDILAPYDIDVTFSGSVGDAAGAPNTYILTANEADKLYFIEAESMTGGSSTADANASGGNVHQISDAGADTLTDSSFALDANARLFGFYVVVKPSSTVTNWTITAYLYYSDTYDESESQSSSVVVGGSNAIQLVPLGIIGTGWQPGRFKITFTPDANNGENLKVDYICGIAIDDSSNIIKINPSGNSFATGDQYKVQQQLLGTGQPVVPAYEASSVVAYFGHEGNTTPHASGSAISSLVFGVGASYYIYDADNTKEADYTFTATRYDAYLTPP
jgi:hypothetical protein